MADMTQKFSVEVLSSADVKVELTDYGVIEVSGDDARTFLGNLLTGDVRKLSPECGLFTAWCDAKGRTLATFWLMQHREVFYLVLPGTRVEAVVTGMSRYILRSKVSMRDASSRLARIGLAGNGIAARFETMPELTLPTETHACAPIEGGVIMAIAGHPHPRWLVVGEPLATQTLTDRIGSDGLPADSRHWSLLDILAGIPLIVTETAGEFIPQMLNLESLGGMCFNKGCYPGQEVIARLHFKGQLKRQLFKAHSATCDTIPVPGTRLYGEEMSESLGEVVQAAAHPDGGVIFLAVVKLEVKDQSPVHLANPTGPLVRFEE